MLCRNLRGRGVKIQDQTDIQVVENIAPDLPLLLKLHEICLVDYLENR